MAYTTDMFAAMQDTRVLPRAEARPRSQANIAVQPNTGVAAMFAMTNYKEPITADKVFVSSSDFCCIF